MYLYKRQIRDRFSMMFYWPRLAHWTRCLLSFTKNSPCVRWHQRRWTHVSKCQAGPRYLFRYGCGVAIGPRAAGSGWLPSAIRLRPRWPWGTALRRGPAHRQAPLHPRRWLYISHAAVLLTNGEQSILLWITMLRAWLSVPCMLSILCPVPASPRLPLDARGHGQTSSL